MTAMFPIVWLLFVASAVSALEEPFSNDGQGLQDNDYKLKDLANTGSVEVPAETLTSIILEQGKTIQDMEKKMNMMTETVNQQGGQILQMQEKITDMENVIQKQNQEINNLKNENGVLHDIIIDQRAEMDSMGKELMEINEIVREVGEGNLMKSSKTFKDKASEYSQEIPRTNLNDVLQFGIRKNSKPKTTATTKTGDKVKTDNMPEYITKQKDQNGLYNEGEPQIGITGNGHLRLQKRAVTHVAFSTYLSHSLDHLSIGHVIKLDQIFLNDGNGYNKYTGVFTVPASGVYLLTYSLETHNTNPYLEVELVVNNRNMGTLVADTYTVPSKTIITRLTAGQSVWLEVTFHAGVTIDSNTVNKFTTFSGVLLY